MKFWWHIPCIHMIVTEWTGGLYVSPTIAGSRAGGLIAGAWAAMISLGSEGYRPFSFLLVISWHFRFFVDDSLYTLQDTWKTPRRSWRHQKEFRKGTYSLTYSLILFQSKYHCTSQWFYLQDTRHSRTVCYWKAWYEYNCFWIWCCRHIWSQWCSVVQRLAFKCITET